MLRHNELQYGSVADFMNINVDAAQSQAGAELLNLKLLYLLSLVPNVVV